MAVTFVVRSARETPTTLVVVVHGLRHRILETVPPVVAERLPDADILQPTYEAGWASSADPVALAAEISDGIEEQCRRHREQAGSDYVRLILIGHSRGALLLRKAYVFARGENQELSVNSFRPVAKDWHKRVERIILLAGMNRGWSLSPKPSRMSWAKWVMLRSFAAIARLTGSARFLMEICRGSPFVVNLRIQWIQLCRRGPMPLVVQILGDMDDLVAPEDNMDLQAGRDFVYLKAPAGTTHATVVELSDPARRAVFLRALDGRDLTSEYVVPEVQQEDLSVQRVVFVLHGIRDFGGWTVRLANALKAQARGAGRLVETVTAGYGYFPMGKFLLFSERQKNVRWFMDRYTEVLAKYRNAEQVDFVGHSNGTYLLGSALRRYRACTFGQVVCAGSVLPRDFEWDEMVREKRIVGIRNYLSRSDWVVGIFPYLFDRFGDIGGGGFLGFIREPAAGSQTPYVSGGHSGAIVDANFKSIGSFLLDGTLEAPPSRIRVSQQSGLWLLLSNLNWVVWLLLAGLIALAGWYVVFAWGTPALIIPYTWLRAVIFLTLLLALLNTV